MCIRDRPRHRRQGQRCDRRAQPRRQGLAARMGRAGDRRHDRPRQDQRHAGAGRPPHARADPPARELRLEPVAEPADGVALTVARRRAAHRTDMNQVVIPIVPDNGGAPLESLYVSEAKIQPRSVSGWFATWRWLLVWFTQLLFYGLPWLSWNGRQAVLLDLAARRFYIFGMVLHPQDVIYLAGLLILSAFALFFFTTVAGRLWCGYACPQTVDTKISMWDERRFEGDRQARIKLDSATWSLRKLARRGAKQAVWLAIGLWTGFTFVAYFTPARTLLGEVASLGVGPWEAFWILFYGFATY